MIFWILVFIAILAIIIIYYSFKNDKVDEDYQYREGKINIILKKWEENRFKNINISDSIDPSKNINIPPKEEKNEYELKEFPKTVYSKIYEKTIFHKKYSTDLYFSRPIEILIIYDNDEQYCYEILYRTNNENWFIYIEKGYYKKIELDKNKKKIKYLYDKLFPVPFDQNIIPYTNEEALNWFEKNSFYKSIKKYFPKIVIKEA
jgi:hypothetical protein